MADCNHDCSSCGKTCAERAPQDLHEKPHAQSHIKKVIAVVSGKGGVGKSLVTSLLAVNSSRNGFHTAILDATLQAPPYRMFSAYMKRLLVTEKASSPSEARPVLT